MAIWEDDFTSVEEPTAASKNWEDDFTTAVEPAGYDPKKLAGDVAGAVANPVQLPVGFAPPAADAFPDFARVDPEEADRMSEANRIRGLSRAGMYDEQAKIRNAPEATPWSVTGGDFINSTLQVGQEGVGSFLQGVNHAIRSLPLLNPSDDPGTIDRAEKWRSEQMAITPEQSREVEVNDPLWRAGQLLKYVAEESHPVVDPTGNLSLAGRSVGGFLPAALAGWAFPIVYGLQVAGDELTTGYDQLIQSGKTPNDAAQISSRRALVNGVAQGVLAEFLPARLRGIGDKAIDQLAVEGMTRFFTRRGAQAAEGAGFGSASAVAGNVIGGRDWDENIGSAAGGMALIQSLLPRSVTPKERQVAREKYLTDYITVTSAEVQALRDKLGKIEGPGLNSVELSRQNELKEIYKTRDFTPDEEDEFHRLSQVSRGASSVLSSQSHNLVAKVGKMMGQKFRLEPGSGRGGFAWFDKSTGEVVIDPMELTRGLIELPEKRHQALIEAIFSEEGIHRYISNAEAQKIYDQATSTQRLIARQRYFGNISGVNPHTGERASEVDLGHEIFRAQAQFSMGEKSAEVTQQIGMGKISSQSLLALERFLFNMKGSKFFGSKEGQLQNAYVNGLINRIQEARQGKGTQPEAKGGQGEAPFSMRHQEIDRFKNLSRKELDREISANKGGVTDLAYQLAEKVSAKDIPALESARNEWVKQGQDRMEEIKQIQDPKAKLAAMQGFFSDAKPTQFFEEAKRFRQAMDEAVAKNAKTTEEFARIEHDHGVGKDDGVKLKAAVESQADRKNTVILYRGEGGNGRGGEYWSSDPSYARNFGADVSRVEVPKEVADAALESARAEGSGTPNAYKLPPEWVKRSSAMENPPGETVHVLDESFPASMRQGDESEKGWWKPVNPKAFGKALDEFSEISKKQGGKLNRQQYAAMIKRAEEISKQMEGGGEQSFPASTRHAPSQKSIRMEEARKRIAAMRLAAQGKEIPPELKVPPKGAGQEEYGPVPPEDRVGINRPTPAIIEAAADLVLSEKPTLKVSKSKPKTSGEPETPPRFTWKRPRFDNFVREIGWEGKINPAQLLEIWEDKVWHHLMDASGDRIAELRKALGMENNYGTRKVPDLETAPESLDAEQGLNLADKKSYRATREARQRYRNKLIGAIGSQLIQESTGGRADLNRSTIAIDDIDFSVEKSDFQPYQEIGRKDLTNLYHLNSILRDQARVLSVDPETASRRLVAVVDSQGRAFLLSTYNDSGVQRVVAPEGTTLKNRPYRELNQTFLNQYRPFASILLVDPVRGLRQKFGSVSEFMDKLGGEAASRSRIGEWGDVFRDEPKGEFTAEDSVGIQGEGGSFMGPERQGFVSNGKPSLKSKTRITTGEARSILDHMVENFGEMESASDVTDAIRILESKKRLNAREFSAINAYRKIFKKLELDHPEDSVKELTDQMADKVFEAARDTDSSEEFARKIVSEFGREKPLEEKPRKSESGRELTMRGDIRPPTSQNEFAGPFQRAEAPSDQIAPRESRAFIPESMAEPSPIQTEAEHYDQRKFSVTRDWAVAFREKASENESKISNAKKIRRRAYRKYGVLMTIKEASKLSGYEGPASIRHLSNKEVKRRTELVDSELAKRGWKTGGWITAVQKPEEFWAMQVSLGRHLLEINLDGIKNAKEFNKALDHEVGHLASLSQEVNDRYWELIKALNPSQKKILEDHLNLYSKLIDSGTIPWNSNKLRHEGLKEESIAETVRMLNEEGVIRGLWNDFLAAVGEFVRKWTGQEPTRNDTIRFAMESIKWVEKEADKNYAEITAENKALENESDAPSSMRQAIKKTGQRVRKSIPELIRSFGSEFDEPMIQTLERMGGYQTALVASDLRSINHRFHAKRGLLSNIIDTALRSSGGTRTLKGKKGIIGAVPTPMQLRDINRANEFIKVPGITYAGSPAWMRMLTGEIPIPDSLSMLMSQAGLGNISMGKMYESEGRKFKASGKLQNNMTRIGVEVVRENGARLRKLTTAVFKANREAYAKNSKAGNVLTLAEVREDYRKLKEKLDEPQIDFTDVMKLNQDFAQKYPNPVTHVFDNGRWHEIYHSSLFNYLQHGADRAAYTAAFREVYPQTDAGRERLAAAREAVAAEVGPKGIESFDDLIRTLQGRPRHDYTNLGLISPSTPIGRLYRLANETVGQVFAKLVLTGQMAVQPGETLMGAAPIFGGYKNYLRSIARARQLYPQMELLGQVNPVMMNFSWDSRNRMRSSARIAGNSISKVAMEQMMNEAQETLGAAMGNVMAERITGNVLTNWEKRMFPETFKAMGFNKQEVGLLMAGDKELLGQFKSQAASFLSGGNRSLADQSKWGASPAFNSVFRFMTYPMTRVHQFRQLSARLSDAWLNGNRQEKSASTEMMARFMVGATGQGAVTALLAALAYGGISGGIVAAKEAWDEPRKFLFQAYMATVMGPYYLLFRSVDKKGFSGLGDAAGRLIWPYSVAKEIFDFGFGTDSYRDKDLSGKIGVFLKTKTPGLKMMKTGAALLGLSHEDRELNAAMSGWNRFRRDKYGFKEVQTYLTKDPNRDFRVAMGKALEAMKTGDQKEFEKQYEAAGDLNLQGQLRGLEEGRAMTKTSLKSRFTSKKVFKDAEGRQISDADMQKLRHRIGDRAMQKLEDYNLMLEVAGDGVLLNSH